MNAKEAWLEKGYELFALHGPKNLTINKVAKEINQTRTSFYYYFNDLIDFINELIQMHLKLFDIFTERAKIECKKYKPDMFKLLADFPMGLLFHKQLFNHRSNPLFNFTYMKCNDRASDDFVIDLFKEYYHLDSDKNTIKLIYDTLRDSWFSRFDGKVLSVESLAKISDDIMESILLLLNKSKNP